MSGLVVSTTPSHLGGLKCFLPSCLANLDFSYGPNPAVVAPGTTQPQKARKKGEFVLDLCLFSRARMFPRIPSPGASGHWPEGYDIPLPK